MKKRKKNHTEVKVFSKKEAESRIEELDRRLGKDEGAYKEREKCRIAIEG